MVYEIPEETMQQLMDNIGYAREALEHATNHNDIDTQIHGRLAGMVYACERLLKSAVAVPDIEEDIFSDISEEVIDG